ncbi:MAG TPA: ACT domain-containing protein [Candidatus Latescibacteria bacterium]|nr:ACT domain-containing protein [Candidatus Latescibacterota bacterium]
MSVRQISVFLENRSGRLSEVARILGDEGINIRALSLADTSDFGILRLIVNEPDKAYQILKDANFVINKTRVLAAEVEDRPGGLARLLGIFESADVNVEYMYAVVEKATENAVMIIRVEDIEGATSLLRRAGIRLLGEKEVYSL